MAGRTITASPARMRRAQFSRREDLLRHLEARPEKTRTDENAHTLGLVRTMDLDDVGMLLAPTPPTSPPGRKEAARPTPTCGLPLSVVLPSTNGLSLNFEAWHASTAPDTVRQPRKTAWQADRKRLQKRWKGPIVPVDQNGMRVDPAAFTLRVESQLEVLRAKYDEKEVERLLRESYGDLSEVMAALEEDDQDDQENRRGNGNCVVPCHPVALSAKKRARGGGGGGGGGDGRAGRGGSGSSSRRRAPLQPLVVP